MPGRTVVNNFIAVGLFLVMAVGWPVRAAEITVLKSAVLPPYSSALAGFSEVIAREVPSRGQKAIQAHTITTLVLSDAASQVELRQRIVDARPDLLVAIGSSSLSLLKDILDIPIVYLMVPFPEAVAEKSDHITGISMNISAARQLEALTLAAPTVKNIGLLYDPERTGSLVEDARDYAARNHLHLIAQPVRGTDEVAGQLSALKGRIDWLWMVPDLTVLTPQSVDYLMLFSLENRVPIFTFAKKYLEMGALLSVSVDPHDLGRQAGEMAGKILHGGGTDSLPPPEGPRQVRLESNSEAAGLLGIKLRVPEGE